MSNDVKSLYQEVKRAIVRRPGQSIVSGLSEFSDNLPIYEKALEQHDGYVKGLRECGLDVLVLDASEEYPDSTFVEDAAVLTPVCAIVTAPGAESRKGEIQRIEPTLVSFFPHIERIMPPGTLEGGDVMQIGTHFYVGLSGRTNQEGARQFITILAKYGLTGSTVPVHNFLHLKTGVTWIGNNILVVDNGFIIPPELQNFSIIQAGEDGAANCIGFGDKIMMPAGCPKTKKLLCGTGSEIIEVDISEFAKIDGGLTCLSLRF